VRREWCDDVLRPLAAGVFLEVDALMEDQTRNGPNPIVTDLFAPLPRRYDLLVELLSFGQNRRWRRAMVDQVVAGGPQLVLDVATGTAGVALQLVRRTPATVVGLDLSEAMLAKGRQNVASEVAEARVFLAGGRAEELPFPDGTFDALTFTYLLRYVDDPAKTLRELTRVLRPAGVMASLEFCEPPNRFWRGWWWLYTRLVLPGAGSLWGRGWYRVGRFLGPSISHHYRDHPVRTIVDAWQAAEMVDVEARLMSLGGGLVMWGRKRDG
jgi:demethylmenaquinone methyltransferase/2-methoxy-6-polyprenyl-1,4-benzoquinol methylase